MGISIDIKHILSLNIYEIIKKDKKNAIFSYNLEYNDSGLVLNTLIRQQITFEKLDKILKNDEMNKSYFVKEKTKNKNIFNSILTEINHKIYKTNLEKKDNESYSNTTKRCKLLKSKDKTICELDIKNINENFHCKSLKYNSNNLLNNNIKNLDTNNIKKENFRNKEVILKNKENNKKEIKNIINLDSNTNVYIDYNDKTGKKNKLKEKNYIRNGICKVIVKEKNQANRMFSSNDVTFSNENLDPVVYFTKEEAIENQIELYKKIHKNANISKNDLNWMRNLNKNLFRFDIIEENCIKMYCKANKIANFNTVDFLKVCKEKFKNFWFSSVDAGFMLFKNINKEFMFVWHDYLNYKANQGYLEVGTKIHEGYFRLVNVSLFK